MSEPFLGEIRIFPYNFAPRGWAFCNGQILSISQNTALFALLGTTYGGNGQTTFALPDLRGRVAIHQGQGPGLSPYDLGEQSGVETVTLIGTQMPQHNHLVNAANNDATDSAPVGNVPAVIPSGGYTTTATGQMSPSMVGQAGGSQPHTNVQPFLTLSFCIALQGIFPSRN
ncbi:MAG TPA: tail fiber protein [Actinomycetota bacterium]|jgi:microcystin-dependent protein